MHLYRINQDKTWTSARDVKKLSDAHKFATQRRDRNWVLSAITESSGLLYYVWYGGLLCRVSGAGLEQLTYE